MKSLLSITAEHSALHADWQKALDSGVFTEGPFVRRLEEAVEEFYGYPAAALNSAGTALFSVMRVLNMPPRQGVMVPVNTFFATGAMVREAGLNPILVDTSMSTFCMSLDHMDGMWKDAVVRAMTSAVVYTPVGGGIFTDHYFHAAGFAHRNKLHFVTDAAHSLGIGRGLLGKYGPTVFSLYPTKAVPSGEGGIVIGRSEDWIGEIKDFRNYGKYKDPLDLNPDRVQYKQGFNFRMDEWTAVVAYHQMQALPRILDRRAAVAEKMQSIVKPMIDWRGETNWYRYIVDLDFKATKTVGKVYARTDQLDHALGMVQQRSDEIRYPGAKHVANHHQCLPLHEKMADWSVSDIERFITTDWEGPQ
jgi:dTDP-4-amino-4,6-dideoxygalactose transaminase